MSDPGYEPGDSWWTRGQKKREAEQNSAEANWVAKQESLIAALEEGGHQLSFVTTWVPGAEGGGQWGTKMHCGPCGAE